MKTIFWMVLAFGIAVPAARADECTKSCKESAKGCEMRCKANSPNRGVRKTCDQNCKADEHQCRAGC
jgi:hypothetical protein